MSIPNTPVPDELAAVRSEIKRLEERESELKRLILTNEDCRSGNEWVAEVKVIRRQQTDMKELRAAYPEQVAEHTYPRDVETVVLSGLTDDGEVVSARKKITQAYWAGRNTRKETTQ